MTMPTVDLALAMEWGLSEDEFDSLVKALGRDPTVAELGMASVMWSEHCSYKSSRLHLKNLPTEGPQVIIGPGENAGVVDIGDNQAVVFKMESHNHPSFIEPYQGAATGVGGICRDVFTMGARPIAVADCLRFGRPDHEKTAYLLAGVVAGVGGYGNSFGVPNVAGDVDFRSCYDGNNLVNAFCLGLAPADRIFLGEATGVGNSLVYVGTRTGRDGIHGATMASAEFNADAEEKRPSVQVGDPFMEKLLLEACLELMGTDLLVGIQDMGAAGITSSSVEMAARAGSGVDIDLDKVPMREQNMSAYEILLSESQERMLMVIERGREDEAIAIFDKWDLSSAVIGHVTDSGRVVIRKDGAVCADLPAELLAEGVVYDRPTAEPKYLGETAAFAASDVTDLADADTCVQTLRTLIGAPNIASKRWIYEQYDYNVRHGTVVRPGEAGAGVVRVFVPGSDRAKGVAISAGCCSRYVYLAPYEGTVRVVAEAYANLVAVGAKPLAVTNCLNFGNPEKPDIMWQFAESVRGIGQACRDLSTPVVSGNVSLYNETEGRAIWPTPMIGMVGLVDPVEAHARAGFERGHTIAVVGDVAGGIGASEYLERIHDRIAGKPVPFDSGAHMGSMEAVRQLVRQGVARSATDVSDGGLLPALAECALLASGDPCGIRVELPLQVGRRVDELLFGEGPARFVVSIASDSVDRAQKLCDELGAPFVEIGQSTGDEFSITISGGSTIGFSVPLSELSTAFDGVIDSIAAG